MTRVERRALFARIIREVCTTPGHLDPGARRGAHDAGAGAALPTALATLANVVRAGAWTIADEDVAAALRAGHSEDELFELTVATALGESRRRLDRVLELLGRGTLDGAA
jgi:hypothetical protein